MITLEHVISWDFVRFLDPWDYVLWDYVGLHSEFLGVLWLLNIPTWAVVARIFRRMK